MRRGRASFLDSGALEFAAPLLRIALPASDRVPAGVLTEPGSLFELERKIGRGGMATVYLARDAKHDRRVAVKVLHAEVSALVGAPRFVDEIRLTARLQHPHVLPLLDSGVFGGEAGALAGRPYYVMPYLEGESLRARLVRGSALPLGDCVRVLRDVADALSYAHEQGIVHRDIKPENILLSGGHAVVADFGIAKALFVSQTEDRAEGITLAGSDGNVTRLSSLAGTPAYMAPEQADGRSTIDHRADLYSWGLVAYELLAGRHPFADRTSAHDLALAQMRETPASLRGVAPTVPSDLALLVMACLAKSPADRPSAGSELLAALDAAGVAASSRVEPPAASPQRARVVWLVAAGLAVGALALGARAYRGESSAQLSREGAAGGSSASPMAAQAREAVHSMIVVGTGDPSVDVPAVQAAVNGADTVILRGRFSFNAPPSKRIDPAIAGGLFPPAAQILLSKAVAIVGEHDARGDLTTIEAGTIPFYVDAPGAPVMIRALRFVRPVSHAILVHAVRGLEISGTSIEGLVPFASVAEGIAIDTQGDIPSPGSPGAPEIVSGRILISTNYIDATGGSAQDGTAGVSVFSAGRASDREVDLDIDNNTIRNTTGTTIMVRRVNGRVRIVANTLSTSFISQEDWGADAVRLVNSGSYLMSDNVIECHWSDGVGIAVFSQYAEWPARRVIIDHNDVRMTPPAGAVFSDTSAAISIRGFTEGSVVRRNIIRGRSRAGVSVTAFRGGIPSGSELLDNHFAGFDPTVADIVIGIGVHDRRIIGSGTVVDENKSATIAP